MPDRASILIVDDRPEKVIALEAVLEELGQRIVRAYSGREALRELLAHEFAVILLDVNMPGMDGFETATMIRQRKSSEQTPIIFITAFGDEMHAARSYSLGAVDFILAPVSPDVLRTKVAVFVDLYTKTEQIRRQAESLRRRAAQLQKLAAASAAINGAHSVQKMLQTITETARDIIGAHQAITMFLLGSGSRQKPTRTMAFTCFSDKYDAWRNRELHLDGISMTLVAQRPTATRLSESELRSHPDWDIVRNADIPPVKGGMMAAPLNGRDGTSLGVIYLSDRYEGDFSDDDEAILVQLAQMGSIAIENSIYAEEREANRVKDEFLATLSHELRTPLNAILGWTQILRTDDGGLGGDNCDQTEVLHGLEVIERNARSQAKLIEDLLDVSRITTGKMRLNLRPIQLGKVISAAADAIRPVVDEKQIKLDCRIDNVAADANLMGDPDRLQQVFWNLLSNAAKFTPNGGAITCRLERVETGNGSDVPAGAVRLQVTDSGAGISPKFLPFVFDRFRQADSSSTRSHGGLGIGLTIVRHIVEMHSGEVRADSAGEGHGATFSVTLPLIAKGESTNGDGLQSVPAVVKGATNNGQSLRLAGMSVLVVDDEPDAREVVAQILTRAGAKVIALGSAAQAREILHRERFDVLVSDIAMPDEDGFDLIAYVRTLPRETGGLIPAIALTAYAREEDRQRALSAGFQSHLTKPIEPEQLVNALARWNRKAVVEPGEGSINSKVAVG